MTGAQMTIALDSLNDRAKRAGHLFPESVLSFAYSVRHGGEATEKETSTYFSLLQWVQGLEAQAQLQREAGDVPEV